MRASREVRDRLTDLALTSFVRTTGGKGLHIVAPITRTVSWQQLKAFARALSNALESDAPKRFIAKASKSARAGKIYVDYLRNEQGATAIASYSTRARAGATVATPLRWNEIRADLDPKSFNVGSIPGRLTRQKGDPWEGFFELRQAWSKSRVREDDDGALVIR